MVDIWIDNEFYVVQIDSDVIGMSLITEENPGFDTKSDISFKDAGKFKNEFQKIFL